MPFPWPVQLSQLEAEGVVPGSCRQSPPSRSTQITQVILDTFGVNAVVPGEKSRSRPPVDLRCSVVIVASEPWMMACTSSFVRRFSPPWDVMRVDAARRDSDILCHSAGSDASCHASLGCASPMQPRTYTASVFLARGARSTTRR